MNSATGIKTSHQSSAGFFINFISQPVISGFTSAVAVTIASSQLKGLFGLKSIETKGVFDTWYKVFLHIKEAVWQDIVLGLSCIVTLTIIKYIHLRNNQMRENDPRNTSKYVRKFLFYLNVGRNALIVFVASLIAFSLDGDNQPFSLTGEVAAGIPSPKLPPFSITINNQTMTFEETIKDIGLGVIMVPLIGILNDVAVVSSFSKGNGFDITQEITVLGLINIIGSFFRSMPTTACFSRTAVNATSGVRTPAAGLLTGISVLIALATKKLELIHLILTFVACLFIGLEWGILLGISVNLVCMLFKLATPTVSVDHANFPQSNYPFVLVTPNNGMLYPSSMHIRTVILKAGMKEGNGILPVVVDCSHIVDFDYTSLKGLIGMMDSYKKSEQPLIFLNMKPTIISRIITVKIKRIDLHINMNEIFLTLKKNKLRNKFNFIINPHLL
ncbi:Sodium-independent sulfate anion transporter [Armadillidium vulgare]|nr:Sodium-independent sulfate anion transporter [Armadillidium vulgare]